MGSENQTGLYCFGYDNAASIPEGQLKSADDACGVHFALNAGSCENYG